MAKKYSLDWAGDGEHIKYFDSKKKAYEYIEMCSGVFVEEVQ